jgi:hypothetical protein
MLLTCQFVSRRGRAMLGTGKSQSESKLLPTTTLLSVFFAIMMTIPRSNNSSLLKCTCETVYIEIGHWFEYLGNQIGKYFVKDSPFQAS